MKKILLVLLAMFVVFSSPAIAETNSSSSAVVAGAGVAMPIGGDVEKGEVGFQANLLVPVWKVFCLEAEVLRAGDHLEAVDMSIFKVGASLVLRTDHKKWFGQVKVGLDYNQIDFQPLISGVDVSVENAIGTHLGAGVGLRLNDHFSLFLDYTMYWLDTTARIWSECEEETVEGPYDHHVIGAGIKYRF